MHLHWNLHGINLAGMSNDASLCRRWAASFASCLPGLETPDVTIALDVVPQVLAPPAGEPQYRQGELLSYYLAGHGVTAHLPRFGQLRIDLEQGTTSAQIVRAVLAKYGVLEDLIAISLSPHLRRRGLFLLHAFAAAREDKALLLVGGIGAGKTTTGLALLNAGWKLLSNDSPIINAQGQVLHYPGLLAAYPATFARFESTAHLANRSTSGQKETVAAETLWPDAWQAKAPVAAILFLQIDATRGHALEPLSPPETLRRLLPHAVEQWDREMIPAHLAALRCAVEAAPGYIFYLGPDVLQIPDFLERAFNL